MLGDKNLEFLFNLQAGESLIETLNSKPMKEKIGKSNFVKVKIYTASNIKRQVKKQLTKWETYLQLISQTKGNLLHI